VCVSHQQEEVFTDDFLRAVCVLVVIIKTIIVKILGESEGADDTEMKINTSVGTALTLPFCRKCLPINHWQSLALLPSLPQNHPN
jgi:hypothetical protein